MTSEDIQRIFLEECEEGLGAAERALLACREGAQDGETINTIFRAVHSIKGGAGAFGHVALQAFSHAYETVLQQVRDGERALDDALLTLLLRAFDTLADHVVAIGNGAPAPLDAGVKSELEATAAGEAVTPQTEAPKRDDGFDFDALLSSLDAVVPLAPAPTRFTFTPTPQALDNGGEPILLLRELRTLDAGAVIAADWSAVPTLAELEADAACLSWTVEMSGDVPREAILELFDFLPEACRPVFDGEVVETVAEISRVNDAPVARPAPLAPVAQSEPVSSQAAPAAPVASIRVDLDKLDRLVDTVGELVITQAMIAQRLAGLGAHAEDELAQLDYLTRELQDCAMALRAQPIRSVFSRVPRIIREVEAETGKRVRLEVEGETTELDKTVIERIGEPLTHLIRNAIDHGIEAADARAAAGKPAEGCVRLAAEHRGGRIHITVGDDGKGIDRARVLAKARERGIVPPDAKLSDEDIDALIFAPGFSTAATVSNISGRGVGMDVVRQSVTALGGRVGIASTPGKGSVFTLALPLTLAIADAMIVTVADQALAVPLTQVVECLRPDAAEVQAFDATLSMLRVRERFVPVLPLGAALGIDGGLTDPSQAVLVITETEACGAVALLVDAIRDQRQIVIKSLESNYRAVEGVAGATILGDGRVAMIVDVEALAERCKTARSLAA